MSKGKYSRLYEIEHGRADRAVQRIRRLLKILDQWQAYEHRLGAPPLAETMQELSMPHDYTNCSSRWRFMMRWCQERGKSPAEPHAWNMASKAAADAGLEADHE